MNTKEIIVERKVDTRKVNREKAKYRMKKMGFVQFCKHGRMNNRYGTKKRRRGKSGKTLSRVNAPMSIFAQNWRAYAKA